MQFLPLAAQVSSPAYNFTGQVPRDAAYTSFTSYQYAAIIPYSASGTTGTTGTTGPTGATGATGSIGTIGATGIMGPTGVVGNTGTIGATGATGTVGAIGVTGATGAAGSVGATGARGSFSGVTGATGPTGIANGFAGPAGPTGANGPDGLAANIDTMTVFRGAKLSAFTEPLILFTDASGNITEDPGFSWDSKTATLQLRDKSNLTVAVGYNAGLSNQSNDAVAIGSSAGMVSQGTQAIAIGTEAGKSLQGPVAVAIGYQAAMTNQGTGAIAVGALAGQQSQGVYAVAVGYAAGNYNQQSQSIAIGPYAAQTSLGAKAIAIGAGTSTQTLQDVNAIAIIPSVSNPRLSQQQHAIAIGSDAGAQNQEQKAIAIGRLSGNTNQGTRSIALGAQCGQRQFSSDCLAIGFNAGSGTQQTGAVAVGLNCITIQQFPYTVALGSRMVGLRGADAVALGASSTILTNTTLAGFYAQPVRTFSSGASALTLTYDTVNKEIVLNSAKTFVIDHPLRPKTEYLVHACIEGPEIGVFYRGKAVVPAGDSHIAVSLPDYVAELATDFTVYATPVDSDAGRFQVSRVGVAGRFYIYLSLPLPYDQVFFWQVMGKRAALETEIPKSDRLVKKNIGPYTWLTEKQ